MSSRRKMGNERSYYIPPAMRKSNPQQQQQQRQKSKTSSPSSQRRGSESDSNLDRFLEYTTPAVPAQHFPRTNIQAWRNRNLKFHPYFVLSDLWESFSEWSVYGAGVPLVLNGTDSVVQYYVPSLSGIQLYVDPSRNAVESRRPGEESDTNTSSSDGDNECRPDRSRTQQGQEYNKGRNQTLSGSSIDGVDNSNPSDLLIFEYFERELPFHREPLADKISILASRFPVLNTYRSCDLAPSSWISIAWYPIYRIPVGPTLQNVDACFLTFHSLAKPVKKDVEDSGSKLLLQAFGLVSHKFEVSDWSENVVQEGKRMSSLSRVADNWLRLLQVNHPDYSFFTSHGTNWR